MTNQQLFNVMVTRDILCKSRWRYYREYRDSPEWRGKRDAVRARAGGYCEDCHNKEEYLHRWTPRFEVHHCRYPEVLGTESIDDLVLLCPACHTKRHLTGDFSKPPSEEDRALIPHAESMSRAITRYRRGYRDGYTDAVRDFAAGVEDIETLREFIRERLAKWAGMRTAGQFCPPPRFGKT